MPGKKLYRVEENKVLGGVALGLANYFEVDVVLVRLIFVALAFANGLGVLAYLIMWLVVPSEGQVGLSGEDAMRANFGEIRQRLSGAGARLRDAPQGPVLIGLLLVVLGGVFLLDTIVPWIHMGMLWPLALIVVGGYLLLTRA